MCDKGTWHNADDVQQIVKLEEQLTDAQQSYVSLADKYSERLMDYDKAVDRILELEPWLKAQASCTEDWRSKAAELKKRLKSETDRATTAIKFEYVERERADKLAAQNSMLVEALDHLSSEHWLLNHSTTYDELIDFVVESAAAALKEVEVKRREAEND